MLTTPFYISEVLAAIAATIFFYKYKHSPIWLIMPILWMAVITETAGYFYYEYVYPNNNWIYNIYSFLYYIVFYKMIYSFVEGRKRQKIIIALSAIVILAFIGNLFITDPIHKPLTYGKIFGTIVMVIHLMYAAIEALKEDRVFKLKNSLPLFIFVGYLIIEITLVPVSLVRNVELHVWSDEVYYGVNKILGTVLVIANAIFIFAFIWTDRQIKKTS